MTGVITRDSSIMGDPSCTQEAAFEYLKGKKNCKYTDADIKDAIIPAYYEQGRKSGVNPTVAIAQMIHETGYLTSWWCARPRRNPAGIGVTGQTAPHLPPNAGINEWAYDATEKIWKKGLPFESWVFNSVPAHMARLLGYALSPKQMDDNQWYYFSLHTARRSVPARIIGCAPTLAGLEGTWAVPGKGYADKLAAHCNGMIKKEGQK
jgi:hypothetical protein